MNRKLEGRKERAYYWKSSENMLGKRAMGYNLRNMTVKGTKLVLELCCVYRWSTLRKVLNI